MISEILEEAGIDRARARAVRRQLLEGVMLLCRWQLERLEEADSPRRGDRPRGARRVVVE
jgi:endonuclease/exonuclease/phosphatase family metal-dependent hydrolase